MKNSGKLRLGLALIIAGLLIVGIPILLIIFFSSTQNSRINTLNKEAMRLGLPLTAQDMNKLASVPANENSAGIFTKIFALYKEEVPTKSERLLFPYIPRADIKDKSKGIKQFNKDRAQLVKKCQPIFALLPVALPKPYCTFPKDWSDPIKIIQPEFIQLKNISRLIAAKVHVDLDQGNQAQAIKDVQEEYSLTMVVGNDPTMIGALVATAIKNMATAAGRNLFLKNLYSPRILQQIARITTSPAQLDFAKHIKFEFYF